VAYAHVLKKVDAYALTGALGRNLAL
jgi:hypothetical protein